MNQIKFTHRELGQPWENNEATVTMWMVRPDIDAIPIAMFAERSWAETWKDQYCPKGVIESWKFVCRQ